VLSSSLSAPNFPFLLLDLYYVYFLKVIFKKYFLNFYVFICYYKSWSIKNIFQSKENLESIFLKNLSGKNFPEVVKNLEISYCLLIILNLVLKLLIPIYILFWIFIFHFHLLKFNFYIKFGFYFYNCYMLFFLLFSYWNFLFIKFGHHSFDCYLFYLK